jgi:FAD/FMN-containing dehydrogenase
VENDDKEIYFIQPEYDDQLANIVQMCWMYHFKIIVKEGLNQGEGKLQENVLKFIKDIPEKVTEKCLIISLNKLKSLEIDEINGTVKVESGITCGEINKQLLKNGYMPIFPV